MSMRRPRRPAAPTDHGRQAVPRIPDPDPRLRLAVHAADRAPPARDARLLRDPSLRRRRRLRPRGSRRRASSSRAARTASPRATRRARRPPCGRSACRCSASATACRRWPRSWAARSSRARSASSATRRSARAGTRSSSPASRTARNAEGHGLLDVWMSHGDKVTALPPGFGVIAQQRRLRRSRRWPTRRAASTACSSIPRSRTRSRARRSSRASRTTSAAAAQDWNMTDYVGEAVAAHPRAGRQRGGDPRAVGRRRLVGRRGADPQGDRRPAHLRVRRPRPPAPERGRAGDGHVRAQPRRPRRSTSTRPTRSSRRSRASPTPSRSAGSSASCSSTCSSARRRSCASTGRASGSRRARSIPT